MKKLKQIWEILNSPFIIACIAFGLTTYLSNHYQDRNWKEQKELEERRQDYEWNREKKFQILSHKLREGQKSLDEIADTITARLLQSRKLVELLNTNCSQDILAKRWEKYMKSVNDWNHKLILNRAKLEIFVCNDVAQELLSYSDNKKKSKYDRQELHYYTDINIDILHKNGSTTLH